MVKCSAMLSGDSTSELLERLHVIETDEIWHVEYGRECLCGANQEGERDAKV